MPHRPLGCRHAGKEPLLYVMVLLLSLQLRECVAFLARDPSTRAYRADAVHLALALHAAQLLEGPADGGRPRHIPRGFCRRSFTTACSNHRRLGAAGVHAC